MDQVPPPRTNLALAIGCIAIALVVALVWVPLDSGSGLVMKVRSRLTIGDGLAPTVAAAVIGLGGLLLLFQRNAARQPGLSRSNMAFLLRFLAVVAISLALMRWTGPLLVVLANLLGNDLDYRALRDTTPWKQVGFFIGGSFLIAGLIAHTEHRVTWRAVAIAALACAGLIALYDLPFDDLLLPPNGDV
jgi:hypothetical protein